MNVHDILTAPITSTVFAFLLTSIGAITAYLMRPRVKLLWAQTSIFSHRMHPNTDKEFLINTASYIVTNRGRAPANEVEFVLNYKVDELSIWNQRQYTIEINPEGRQIVKFASVAPKEIINVNLINIGKSLPAVLNLRNAERVGKMVEVYPQQKFPRYVTLIVWGLMIFGVYFIVKQVAMFILLAINLARSA
jgi:hypothetical protein